MGIGRNEAFFDSHIVPSLVLIVDGGSLGGGFSLVSGLVVESGNNEVPDFVRTENILRR